jgi:malonyl-CoA O-methyltransferase
MPTLAPSRWLDALATRRPDPPPPRDEAYDLWSDTYPAVAHNPLMRAEQAAVAPTIARLRASRALDVGTGSGRNLALLRATGARLVVGVDRSMGMLERQSGTEPRVRGDALVLPFRSESFELVLASLMVGDVADLRGWTAEIRRVLAPGGHLVYSDFHPSWAARRWRRTFTTRSGRCVEVPYFPHTLQDHLDALDAAALRVVTVREPFLLDDDLREWSVRVRLGGVRVALVVHAVRPGRAPATASGDGARR